MAIKLYGDLEIQTGGELKVDSPDTTFNSISYTWPGADGTSGQVLTTSGGGTLSWTTVSGGGGGTPGGTNTEIQFNDNGSFGGDADFTWDKTGNVLTVNGDLTFSGTSRRIRGDFSNTTHVNRVAFQTSVTNDATSIPIIPNGNGNISNIFATNNSDIANSSFIQMLASGGETRLFSGRLGTGTFLPLNLCAQGVPQVQIPAGVNAVNYLTLQGSTSTTPVTIGAAGTDTNIGIRLQPKGSSGVTLSPSTSSNISLNIGDNSISTQTCGLELGNNRTGSGFAYIDLIGDTTYPDFGLRIIRNNTGSNAPSEITHAGTGDFRLVTLHSASIVLRTASVDRLTVGTTSITSTLPFRAPSGDAVTPGFAFAGSANTGLYLLAAGSWGISGGGTLLLQGNTTQLSTHVPVRAISNGSATAPVFSFNTSTNTGMFSPATNTVGLTSNGTERFRAHTTGVTVVGTTTLNSVEYTWPGADGTSGQVLTTSGGGVLSWTTVSGGAGAHPDPHALAAGSAAAPAYSFTDDTDSGMYRVAADTLGFTVNGTLRLRVSTTDVQITVPVWTTNGTANYPTHSFISDTDTGMYRLTDDMLGFATGGIERIRISTAAVQSSLPVWTTGNGSAGAPAYSFSSNATTGMFLVSSNALALSSDSIERFRVHTTGVTVTGTTTLNSVAYTWPGSSGTSGQVLTTNGSGVLSWTTVSGGGVSFPLLANPTGTAGAPAYSFTGDTDTGMYQATTDALGFSTSGNERVRVTTTAVQSTVPVRTNDGTEGTPAHSFTSDTDTGVYLPGADVVGVATGGSLRLRVASSDIQTTVPLLTSNGSAGAPTHAFTSDTDTGMYRVGTDQLGFATTGISRLTIGSTGEVAVGGAVDPTVNFYNRRDIQGGVTAYGNSLNATVTSAVTTSAIGNYTILSTQAASFTCPQLYHFYAYQGTIGAGSAVTNQYGFVAAGTLIGAANNYGFYSNLPSGTGRWNFYAAGTAANYFNGTTTFNTGVRNSDGNAGAPAYSFSSDTNTGMYSDADDTLKFATNGINALTLNSSQNAVFAGGVSVNGTLQISEPLNGNDAATKAYVDSVAAGLDPKKSCRVASTANITGTFASGSPAGFGTTLTVGGTSLSIDDVTLANNDRVLLKDQSSALQNGIYVVSGIGSSVVLTRATDQDGTPTHEVSGGNFTFIEQGTVSAGRGYTVVASGNINVDVDAVNWTIITGPGGGGVSYPLLANPIGSAAAPAYSFNDDANTGMYSAGGDQINFATNSTLRLTVGATSITSTLPIQGPDGSYITPAYSFSSDTDTGIYRLASNDIGFAGGNALFGAWGTTRFYSTVPLICVNGTAANPTYGFFNIPGYGMFIGDSETSLSAAGTKYFGVSASQVRLASPARTVNGINTAPSFSFINDTDTGMYSVGTDALGITSGGTERFRAHTTGVTVFGTTTLNTVAYTWPGTDGTSGQVLTTNGSGALTWTTVSGGGGGSGGDGAGSPRPLYPGDVIFEKTLAQPNTLVVGTGKMRWYPVQNITIISIQAHVDTPSTGASIIIDVNKNGTTMLSGSPMQIDIPAGSNSSAIKVPGVTSVVVGDYVTVDVDQIGSGTAGADLVVQIAYQAA